ncbi:MAG: SDR family oxidoreductase [Bacteroidetes bacterium]|nr:MAG: SDR family oxidoreductase [Bacteroidota bacterium]
MKILVTGANGFIGQHLCHYLKDKVELTATSLSDSKLPSEWNIKFIKADLSIENEVVELIEIVVPQVVIHVAASSKPDECERQPLQAMQQNSLATLYLVNACKKLKIKHLIYFSSDFVLGDDGPHTEEATPSPLNFYGSTKLVGEEFIKTSGLPYTIFRPVFVYGKQFSNCRGSFIQTVINQLTMGNSMRLVTDQLRTPTLVDDIVAAVYQSIVLEKYGLYHLAGSEILSPYQMAVDIAEWAGLDTSLLITVDEASFPEPVRRAKKGGLLAVKAVNELGFTQTPFKEALKRF